MRISTLLHTPQLILALSAASILMHTSASATPKTSASANAKTSPPHPSQQQSMGVKLSSLGWGAEYRKRMNQQWDFRAIASVLDVSDDERIDTVSMSRNTQSKSLAGMFDYYPGQYRIRLTGGLIYHDTDVKLSTQPNDNSAITLNSNSYDANSLGKLSSKVEFDSLAPYIGIGWSNKRRQHKDWSFSADLGAAFSRKPKASTTVYCNQNLSIEQCKALESDAQHFNIQVEKAMSDWNIIPVLSIGVSRHF